MITLFARRSNYTPQQQTSKKKNIAENCFLSQNSVKSLRKGQNLHMAKTIQSPKINAVYRDKLGCEN